MSYYTVLSPQTLLVGADPSAAAAQLLGITNQPTAPQLSTGDLVSVGDPPTVTAGYTQVTTSMGIVGWLPSSSIQAGPVGSTVMNLGIIGAIGLGVWYFFFRGK